MIINNLNDIPRLIHQRRIEQGLTQVNLANKSGISQQTISSFEKGDLHVSLFTLFKILRALDYQLDIGKNHEIKIMKEMLDIQGTDGNWNYDEGMLGMYNGMEFMLSLVEGREPNYKNKPKTWLKDNKISYEIVSE